MATKNLLVGAIDFGTTFSGWAYSFDHDFELDPTKGYVKQWHSGGTLVTEKTPTCLLVKPDGKTLEAFGYDAENKYRELTDEGLHKEYFYFRRFKMLLMKKLGEKLNRNVTVEDEMGKSLPALQVFSMSIKFLFDDMMKVIADRLTGAIDSKDVHLVLTVPAIWTDAAKQFMRNAAINAGISTKNLTIALEPEAASIFCRHLSVNTTTDGSDVSISKLPTGTKYMILDAGGGTIDITVHEVISSESVKEITAASGGGWGGILVDKAFEDFLVNLLGQKTYETFKEQETEDWIDLWRDFEVKKRTITPERTTRVNMKFPLSLGKTYKRLTGFGVSKAFATSEHKDELEFGGDKLKIESGLFKCFFDDSIQKIIGHVQELYRDEKVDKISTILMVGGYSESPMLQHAVKEAFPGLNIVVPSGASSTILRGALVYGHNPISIKERVLKYTYGVCAGLKFREGIDPEYYRTKTDIGFFCLRFVKYVGKGEVVKSNEPKVEHMCSTMMKYQKNLLLEIYATEQDNLEYPDKGGIYIGALKLELPDPEEAVGRKIMYSMTFSGTEIEVLSRDKKTGKEAKAYIDFLG